MAARKSTTRKATGSGKAPKTTHAKNWSRVDMPHAKGVVVYGLNRDITRRMAAESAKKHHQLSDEYLELVQAWKASSA